MLRLADAVPDALIVVDVSGVITLVNRAAEQLLGYDREELLGQGFERLISRYDQDAAERLSRTASESLPAQRSLSLEVIAARKDGQDITVEVSLNALESGDVKVVVAALRDISGRKCQEHEQRQMLDRERAGRLAAEAAVQWRDAFLATVTHDLRQPLTTIKVRAQLIQELMEELTPDSTTDQIRAWSRRISDTSSTMSSTLSELIDLSQVRIGEPLLLRAGPMDLVELAHRVAAEYHHLTDRHVQVAASGPVVGEWDEIRLERVLHNLVDNALKYSPDGGAVTLTVTPVRDTAVVTVADEGIGIPEADVPHVFNWFHRGSNVTGVAPGAGLGLAGVRQIVEQHGGSIDVQSEEGRGSTFTLRLPAPR